MIDDTAAANVQTDARTNRPHPPVDISVQGPGDLQALRERWSDLGGVPRLLRSREEGVDNSWGDLDVRTLLRGEESSGRFCFHDIIVPPGGSIPVHYHDVGDSYWWVIEGEVELQIGRRVECATRYGIGYAPARTRQGLKNASSRPARLYVAHSPAGAERAFAEAHELFRATGERDPSAYIRILARYGFRFDAEPLENDERVNEPSVRLETVVESFADFEALRDAWRRRRPIPKLAASEPENYHTTTGGRGKLLVSGDETAGHAMCRLTSFPPAHAAPQHHQPTEEEFFYVLEGSVELTCGTSTGVLPPGAFGFAPRNGTHGFKNASSEEWARMLSLNSPAGHERGFEMIERERGSDRVGELLVAHGWRMHEVLNP